MPTYHQRVGNGASKPQLLVLLLCLRMRVPMRSMRRRQQTLVLCLLLGQCLAVRQLR